MVRIEDYESDIIDEIESEGMIYYSHRWIPIETSITVYKESASGKAYWGDITVYECDGTGRVDTLFEKDGTWIPKSMSSNVWWICTNIFDHSDKVSNRRFEGYE